MRKMISAILAFAVVLMPGETVCADDAAVSVLWVEFDGSTADQAYAELVTYLKHDQNPFAFNRVVIRLNDPQSYPTPGFIPEPGSSDPPGSLVNFLIELEASPAWSGQVAVLPYFGGDQANPKWAWKSNASEPDYIADDVFWRKPMLWVHLANEYLHGLDPARSLYFNHVNIENESTPIPHGTAWTDVFCDMRAFSACFTGASPTPGIAYTTGFTGTANIINWTNSNIECSAMPDYPVVCSSSYTGSHIDQGYLEIYGMYKLETEPGTGDYQRTVVDAIALGKCCGLVGDSACVSYCPQPGCLAECGATSPTDCGAAPKRGSVSPSIYSLALDGGGSLPDCVPAGTSAVDQLIGQPQGDTVAANIGFLYGQKAGIDVVQGADLSKICMLFSCSAASNGSGLIDAFGLWDGSGSAGLVDFQAFVTTFDQRFNDWWTTSAAALDPPVSPPTAMPVYGLFQYDLIPDSWKPEEDGKDACPGDFLVNQRVDGGDLGLMLGGYGSGEFDLTGDGMTDGADIGELLMRWGDCP